MSEFVESVGSCFSNDDACSTIFHVSTFTPSIAFKSRSICALVTRVFAYSNTAELYSGFDLKFGSSTRVFSLLSDCDNRSLI